MRGYPNFRMPIEALRPTSGEAVNPHVGPIFWRPLGYLIFYLTVDDTPSTNMKTSTVGPQEVPELKVRERPPSM
jgi:hypothetical protein